MSDAFLATLSADIRDAQPLKIEVLSGAELDMVAGGGPFEAIGPGDTHTTSVCSTDGSDEPGTS